MKALLEMHTELERWMPPLARLLRTLFRAARSMERVADDARAGDIVASAITDRVVGRSPRGDGERAHPGLAQARRAWATAVDGATPSPEWLAYAAWSIEQASERRYTPTAAQVEAYLIGARDAGGALRTAIADASDVLYPARSVDADGAPVDPVLSPVQSAPIVAAIDVFVAAVRGD